MAESAEVAQVEVLLQLRRWPEALAVVSVLLAARPQDANLLYQQARAFAGAERNEEAVSAARAAASAARPTWAAPLRLEASVLPPDQLRPAIEVARRATALGPMESANWVVLADLCQRAYFMREATDAAGEARRLAPSSVMALNASGLVALRLRDDAAAERWFRMGLAIDPLNPHLLNNLALVMGRIGRDDEAMELFERSLTQAPDGHHAWGNLGRASALAVWRGPLRGLFFGGLVLLLVGAAADIWVMSVVGALSVVVSLVWVTIRRRRLTAARRQAIRDATRMARRRARRRLTGPFRRRGRDGAGGRRSGA